MFPGDLGILRKWRIVRLRRDGYTKGNVVRNPSVDRRPGIMWDESERMLEKKNLECWSVQGFVCVCVTEVNGGGLFRDVFGA